MQDLTVAFVQSDIVWENKQANFNDLEQKFKQINSSIDIIVLPEMFQTGFSFKTYLLAEDWHNSETLLWLKKQAKNLNSAICASFMVQDEAKFYNRLVWVQADDKVYHYDKRHLFSMSDEPKHFNSGSNKLMIDFKGWRICPMVCYDLRFPVWIRNTELYDLLIFVANWPQKRSMHWEKLLQARSIENQCYTLGVNRVGNDGNGFYHDGRSQLVNPLGEPMIHIVDENGIYIQKINMKILKDIREKMPFLKDMDSFDLSIS